ncbi:N-ethylammeline chlorohydrolase [Candidatus Magnetoovum chiemensis]|nr:N-ethylammeline chlorohydrolase [Candidatus Magnetoovum chiemensis]
MFLLVLNYLTEGITIWDAAIHGCVTSLALHLQAFDCISQNR